MLTVTGVVSSVGSGDVSVGETGILTGVKPVLPGSFSQPVSNPNRMTEPLSAATGPDPGVELTLISILVSPALLLVSAL